MHKGPAQIACTFILKKNENCVPLTSGDNRLIYMNKYWVLISINISVGSLQFNIMMQLR